MSFLLKGGEPDREVVRLALGAAAGTLTSAPTEGKLASRLQWLLRISMAGTYIGHGAFGIIGKAAWVPYFNLFGFTDSQAWALMPVIGMLDIAFGVVILVCPMRAVMLHLALWGVLTASFRPLVGDGTWQEVFERAGNYCVPLALLVLTGWGGDSITMWFRRVKEAPTVTLANARAVHWILRGGTALLLIGHGGFGVWMHKQVWLDYFGVLGIGAQTVDDLRLFYVVGWFEIALGLAVLCKPARGLLGFVCAYKVSTELLRPMAGEPWWEFIERAGSYVAPVALIVVDRWLLDRAAEPDMLRAGRSGGPGGADAPDSQDPWGTMAAVARSRRRRRQTALGELSRGISPRGHSERATPR